LICTRELFARHNLRCTRQRIALYETLRACTSHPTAEELYRMVQQDGSARTPVDCGSMREPAGSLSRATVYNTLEALCEAGLVRRLPTTNGCCRFDADTCEHLHVRLRHSHQILDVPQHLGERLMANMPRQVLDDIEREMGLQIDALSIQLIASEKR
jgi:Fe2+ or Zn2+ uptake regulation protein